MEKKFKKGTQANYEIELTIAKKDQDEAKEMMLKHFQKDFEMAGFRKGMAPLDVVEKNTKPEYLKMGIYEHLINKGLQELIKEHGELRLIGEPYDLKEEEKGEDTIMTMKLDVFPEVEVKNDDRQKEQLPEIKSAATEKEIQEAVMGLKKNYADYQDADMITLDTISKVGMEYFDTEGKSLDKGHNYIGEQEFAEDKRYEKEFVGKKKGDTVEVVYSEKLPPVYHYKKTEGKATKMTITIEDVKKIILPELNEATIEKLFGKEGTVKTEDQLMEYIKESIAHQKFETQLVQAVEKLLQDTKGKSMDVLIPKTLIEQEFATRIKSLQERFGGEEKMTEYFKKLGDEQVKKFLDEIRMAAKDSLEKFFILQKIVDALKLEVNREKPGHLEIEQKLYAKMGKGHDHHHHDHNDTGHNHTHDEHHEHEHQEHNHGNEEHSHKEAKKTAKPRKTTTKK